MLTVQKKIKSHLDVNYFFFYWIYIEKSKAKILKNIDLLCEHPFYEELSIVKTDHTVKDMSNWLRKKIN